MPRKIHSAPPFTTFIPLMKKQKLVILSGAGMSAESGIATFRGTSGLWEGHRVEEVPLLKHLSVIHGLGFLQCKKA